MRGFLTRKIKMVRGEFNLICAVVNMKKEDMGKNGG
jgi:hypothetical protein